MKRNFLLLVVFLAFCINGRAQFAYSLNMGWDFPKVHKYDNESVSSSFTLGGDVYYDLNSYLNLRSGLRYHYIKEKGFPMLEGGPVYLENWHVSSFEIPLLINFRTQKEVKHWTMVWGAGLFGGIPFVKKRHTLNNYEKIIPYWGPMVSAQLEIRRHYLLRGEYQWYASSDLKDKNAFGFAHKRRITRWTIVCGYKF